jgi:hydrogenase nickel incorporation protein HypA/HybF
MHELSITQSFLDIALEKAKEAQAKKITKIQLIIGELSGVVDDCVQFYFELLSKDTIAEKANLSFNRMPTKVRCRNCATVFTPEELNWACPNCHGQQVEIVSGRECNIESIEIE